MAGIQKPFLQHADAAKLPMPAPGATVGGILHRGREIVAVQLSLLVVSISIQGFLASKLLRDQEEMTLQGGNG